MQKYRILPEETFQELRRLVDRVTEVMAEAGELNLPESMVRAADDERGDGAWSGSRATYRISRSEWQYVDVVEKEMEEEIFSLDELWNAVGPLIETDNKRPRDSLRNALDRDDRYERLEDRSGVWWRRVGEDRNEEEEQTALDAV